jgi:hypothetical protein
MQYLGKKKMMFPLQIISTNIKMYNLDILSEVNVNIGCLHHSGGGAYKSAGKKSGFCTQEAHIFL